MRATALPASPSRKVLTIGMAPPTAASKLIATLCFSASPASSTPCFASSALLAVTTGLPAFSAALTAASAGLPSPPINSTNASIPGSRASSTGSANQRSFFRSMPRSLPRERALTATTSIPRPHLSASTVRCWSIRRTTEAPTVPRPARPTLRGAAMERPRARALQSQAALAPLSERQDVMKLFRGRFKKPANVARGLPDALLVLHKRDTHKAPAALAYASPRRHRHLGLLDQELGEFHAAERLERLGDRRPSEHGSGRRRHLPSGAAKALAQHVATALVGFAHLADAIVGAVEGRGRRDLDRRERAIVEVGFHPAQSRDDAL